MTIKIDNLANKIAEADKAYHNGASIIPDNVYDALKQELNQLAPNHPLISNVGAAIDDLGEFEKFHHTEVLGSLNKANLPEEFYKWAEQYCPNHDFIVTPKLDGLSVYLKYVNGQLQLASSRGNGDIGELITRNVVKIRNVPIKLIKPLSFGVRGEIVLSKELFDKHFKADNYKNPRNVASGVSRRHDGTGCEFLSLIAYKIYGMEFKTEIEQLELLKQFEFAIPEYHRFKSAKECIDFKEHFQTNIRNNYPVELDGLVFVNNDTSLQNKYGFSNNGKNPRATIAYKFENVGVIGFIKDVVWSVGSGGRITPNAVIDPPVNIDGANISASTLHNLAYIKNLGLTIGASVLVERAGQVIPKILEVVEPGNQNIIIPEKCPDCDSQLEMNGENLQCHNTLGCRSQICGRVDNWCSNIGVLEFGTKLIEKLVDSGKVKTVADLYTLSIDDLMVLDRMGEKSARKALDNLHAKTYIDVETLLGSLSIPLVAISTIKMVVNAGFDTLDKILGASKNDFAGIHGLGEVKIDALYNGLRNNREIIDGLLKNGITIKERTKNMNNADANVLENTLTGKSFCFTGAAKLKRKELQGIVETNGGSFETSVIKGLTFLVQANPDIESTKSKAAHKNGAKVISEEEFLALVGLSFSDFEVEED